MKLHRRLRLDRIGSATVPARVGAIVEVSPDCYPTEGIVVAGRALGENPKYGEIELPTGRLAKVVRGNLVAGVLGARQALHGYMGHVPEKLEVGDTISLLNLGGVMGICPVPNRDLGTPIPIEVLGTVVRNGKPLQIRDFALPGCDALGDGAPIVLVVGTCMNAGKTYAASELIRVLSHSGVKIAGGKVSGVAALRDVLRMQDNGAISTASFLDCGLPSTVNTPDLAGVARAVVRQLETSTPDLIVLELGDGILGGYNTGSILADESVRRRTSALVLCANDLVGAWGGVQILQQRGHRVGVVSGPVTDNPVGTEYCTRELGLLAYNARSEPTRLARAIARFAGLGAEIEE